MVAKPETLNRFLFNSDYPTDKVVWLYEGETTSPSEWGGQADIDIEMTDIVGLDGPALYVKGVFTLDNWQTSFMLGSNDNSIDPHKGVDLVIQWYKGNTSKRSWLTITVYSLTQYSVNLPVKYRLWAVPREDINSSADFGKNSGITKSKLAFDSRKNYPRLYKDGIAKSGETITHDLGKIPFVDFWYSLTDGGSLTNWRYYPMGDFVNNPASATVRATDKNITFTTTSGYDTWYYYRIYA